MSPLTAPRSNTRTRVIGQVYPWDLADGPARAHELAEAGVDDVAVAAAYHSVRAIHWAAPTTPAVISEPRSAYYLPIDPSRWGDRLRPAEPASTDATAFARSLDAARSAGLGARAWLVLAHDDEHLARYAPDLATVDAWGTGSTYALCTAQPEVARYCRLLVAETARATGITRFLIESLTPPGFAHSIAHDKVGHSGLDELDTLLLSLCCCPACIAAAAADGWDASELASGIRASFGTGRLDDRAATLIGFALETRSRVAAELAQSLAAPVEGATIEITIAASTQPDAFSPFALLGARPECTTGLCADLSAPAGAGWRDIRAWSVDAATTLAATLQLGAPGRTLAAVLAATDPNATDPNAAPPTPLHELYLYHLGMRRPGTLHDLDIRHAVTPFQGEQ